MNKEVFVKQRTCIRKKKYPTKKAIMTAAAKHNKNYYKCPFCHDYHLTSQGTKNGKTKRMLLRS